MNRSVPYSSDGVLGRGEAEASATRTSGTPRGRSPNSSSSGCSSVPWMTFQPISGPSGARNALAARGLRQQLPAEADAEHRHLAAQRLLDHPSLDRQPGVDRVLVGVHDAAEDDQAVVRPRAGCSGAAVLLANQTSISAPAARSGACERVEPGVVVVLQGEDAHRRKSYGHWTQGVSDGSTVTFGRGSAGPASTAPCGTRISIAPAVCRSAPVDEQAAGRDQPVDGDAGTARRQRRRRRRPPATARARRRGRDGTGRGSARSLTPRPFDQRAVRAPVRSAARCRFRQPPSRHTGLPVRPGAVRAPVGALAARVHPVAAAVDEHDPAQAARQQAAAAHGGALGAEQEVARGRGAEPGDGHPSSRGSRARAPPGT